MIPKSILVYRFLGCLELQLRVSCTIFLNCRIDHYLGKQAVQAIDILKQSSSFESTLNKNVVNSIEIVMKENVDVKGD